MDLGDRPDDAATDAAANRELWERHADWWQAEFTEDADPEYADQILPLAVAHTSGGRRVLEIGTGEGQVLRAIAAAGPRPLLVGLDPSANQVREAARRGGGAELLRADAVSLPFADASFDTVLACLVLEHVDDAVGSITEAARVLSPGGRFVLFINHPLLQTPNSGWIDDQILDPPEQYWRVGDYLTEGATIEEVSSGVFIRFLHRPLSVYVNAMAAVGLAITHMDEPAPPPRFLALTPEYGEAAKIPRLLVLVAERRRAA